MAQTSSRDRLEQALARIADPKGEGVRACLTVYAAKARAAADAADARAKRGAALGPFDGTILSIKDLFDVAGEPTRAGSKILAEEAAPAKADAAIVRRLREAGAVIVAKTNMTEFAFSGIGANPHFGTPGNPRDRSRVPGGSVRIPASLCGVVGFKPSKQRVPTDGAFPLSYTLDSVGPLAKSVAACAAADAVMAGEAILLLEPIALGGLHFGVAEGLPLDRLDDTVAAAFALAVKRLDDAGVRVTHETLPLFEDMGAVNAKGGVSPYEACEIHRDRMARRSADIDPNVRARIARGCEISPADYADMVRERKRLVQAMDARLATLDALLMPTTSIVAPTIAEVADTKVFAARNAAVLRNTAIINFFDLCAISLPLPAQLPVGLMVIGRNGHDHRLLRIAAAVETLLGR